MHTLRHTGWMLVGPSNMIFSHQHVWLQRAWGPSSAYGAMVKQIALCGILSQGLHLQGQVLLLQHEIAQATDL